MQRRSFLNNLIYAAMAVAIGSPRALAEAERKRILVLGGTHFLGPAVVQAALADGHTVILFNRGVSHLELFPYVEKLRGFRSANSDDQNLSSLARISCGEYLRMVPILIALLGFGFVSRCIAAEGPNVLTWHNDNARTGQMLNEKLLAPNNVNFKTFGKLLTIPVDGKVDAEPLYASRVEIPGHSTKDVLFIVTEHDSVYAVDAKTGERVWHAELLAAGETPADTRGCEQISPEIGITSTPVIDRHRGRHGTIYIVAMTKNAQGRYLQKIHALDITDGTEQFNGPTTIGATFPGTGAGSANGIVTFDPGQYSERAALLLTNGLSIQRGRLIAIAIPIRAGLSVTARTR